MLAARYHSFGEPLALKLEEVQIPVPARGEVLVRVRAASVNPVDWKIATGSFRVLVRGGLPRTMGSDFSGEYVGTVEPLAKIGTDRRRLDSYTYTLAVNQATLYAGSNALPSGAEGTADDIKGQPKPDLWGRCYQVPLVPVNTAKEFVEYLRYCFLLKRVKSFGFV